MEYKHIHVYQFEYEDVTGQHNQDAVKSEKDLGKKDVQALMSERVATRNATIKASLESRIAEASAELSDATAKLERVQEALVVKNLLGESVKVVKG